MVSTVACAVFCLHEYNTGKEQENKRQKQRDITVYYAICAEHVSIIIYSWGMDQVSSEKTLLCSVVFQCVYYIPEIVSSLLVWMERNLFKD